MEQTLRAFKYWRHWIFLDREIVSAARECWSHDPSETGGEGLIWHDGYWDSFWYVLNTPWLEMCDKMTARTGETRTYFPPFQSL